MLSRPLTLNEARGRGLSMMTPPPVLPLVDEGIPHSGAPPCPEPPLSSSPPLSRPPPPPPFSPSLSSVSSITPPSDSPHSSCSSPPSGISPAPFPPTSSPPFPLPPSACFTANSFNPPPPVPPPCCPCASLLPRLLAAHRLEVRRLLRGALASLGRRLDSLERRRRSSSRKRRRRRGTVSSAGSLAPSSAPPPPVTSSSSSSDCEELPSPPPLQRSEHSRRRREEEAKDERRRLHRGAVRVEEDDEVEEDERFVGRMAVSFRGRSGEAEKEVPLTLHNFTKRRRRNEEAGSSQSERTTSDIIIKNGFNKPIGFSSEDALHLLRSAQMGWTFSQSDAFTVSSGQWCFSNLEPSLSSPSHSALCLWLSRPPSFSPAPMLRLSEVTMEMLLESVRGGACCSPQRPLKDWTAPPSLSSDHCYIRLTTQSPALSTRRQQKQRANHSNRSLHLLRRRPLPTCLTNGLSAALPSVQSAANSNLLSTKLERGKRVSQIRIRRASPRETPLTPMGLPKVKRLKKKDFSLEEIYTNKNYKSPTTNRSLETIFEEPREKDGALFVIGQQKKRRLLLFPDFTQPRKRKKLQGAGLSVGLVNRKRARRHMHGCDDEDLDVMLVERLSALEDFLSRQGLDL